MVVHCWRWRPSSFMMAAGSKPAGGCGGLEVGAGAQDQVLPVINSCCHARTNKDLVGGRTAPTRRSRRLSWGWGVDRAEGARAQGGGRRSQVRRTTISSSNHSDRSLRHLSSSQTSSTRGNEQLLKLKVSETDRLTPFMGCRQFNIEPAHMRTHKNTLWEKQRFSTIWFVLQHEQNSISKYLNGESLFSSHCIVSIRIPHWGGFISSLQFPTSCSPPAPPISYNGLNAALNPMRPRGMAPIPFHTQPTPTLIAPPALIRLHTTNPCQRSPCCWRRSSRLQLFSSFWGAQTSQNRFISYSSVHHQPSRRGGGAGQQWDDLFQHVN